MSVFRFFKSDNQNLYMQKRKARFQSSLNLLKDTKPRVATTKQNPHLSFGKEEPIPLYKSSYYHSQFLDLKPKVNKEAKAIKIGERFLSQDTFHLGDSPGPGAYELGIPSTKPQKMHLIETRHDEKIDSDLPGPGTYDDSSYTIKGGLLPQGNVNRTEWLNSKRDSTPGPGKYNETPEKLTKGKQNKVMAIGHFYIHLNQFKNSQEAKDEINRYPDLRNIIEEISEQIIKNKPEDPLEYLRSYFAKTDKRKSEVTLSQRTPQKKKHFVGDIDVSILYD